MMRGVAVRELTVRLGEDLRDLVAPLNAFEELFLDLHE